MRNLPRVVITGVGLASPNGSSLAEFRSNTDPTDPQSVFRIERAVMPQPPRLQPYLRNIRFTWPFIRGVRYQVEVSTDLLEWRKLPGPGDAFVEDGQTMMEYTMSIDAPKSFYRVTAVDKTRPRP